MYAPSPLEYLSYKLNFPEKDQAATASSAETLVEMEGNTMGGIPCVQYQVRVHKHQDLVAVVPLATDELGKYRFTGGSGQFNHISPLTLLIVTFLYSSGLVRKVQPS